tara:strand:+ start:496 stop:612 length:117 start_codon:yes stop_codon:yes gene_type:complete
MQKVLYLMKLIHVFVVSIHNLNIISSISLAQMVDKEFK